MKRLATALILGSVALGGPAAFAAINHHDGSYREREAPWRAANQNYEVKHQANMTCGEHATASKLRQPFDAACDDDTIHHKHQ